MKYKIIRKCEANKYKEEVFFVMHPDDWRVCGELAASGIQARGWKEAECLWEQVSEAPNELSSPASEGSPCGA